jgi:hypothetical protein
LSGSFLRIYPNPATDQLQLTGLSPDSPLQVSIVDGSGKVVFTRRTQGQDHVTLDITRLAPGSYTVVLTSLGGMQNIHFLKLAQ